MEEMMEMTNKELEEIVAESDIWIPEVLEEICRRADMEEEYEAADGETFESVVEKAAEKIGIELY